MSTRTLEANRKSTAQQLPLFQMLLALLWGFIALSLLFISYIHVPFSVAISFAVEDGWCQTVDSISGHCFGDFGLPYSAAQQPAGLYESGHPANTNSPLVLALYWGLANFPYRLSLLIWTVVAVMAVSTCIVTLARGLPRHTVTMLVVFGGISSVGVLVAIDRSNTAVFMAPLALALLYARNRWVVLLCGVLILSIKVWGWLLIVPLIAQRRYRAAATIAGASLVLNLILLVPFSTSLNSGLSSFLKAVLDRDYGTVVSRYAVSPVALARKVSCVTGPESWCPTSGMTGNAWLTGLSVAALVVFVLIAYFAARRTDWGLAQRYTPTMCLAFLAVPEAQVYNLSILVAVVALMAADHKRSQTLARESWSRRAEKIMRRERVLALAVASATAMTTAPLPIWVTVDDDFLLRLPYVSVTLVWVPTMVAFAWVLFRDSRDHRRMNNKPGMEQSVPSPSR